MRILFAGSWTWMQYEKAFSAALEKAGHTVIPFAFRDFFNGKLGYYQGALPFPGPALLKLNKTLLKKVHDSKPDLGFFWNATHVLPSTIRQIRKSGIRTVSYSNDDPFGAAIHGNTPWHHHFLWMWYLRCLKEHDINFVNRQLNVREAASFGARNIHVMKPYFINGFHQPTVLDAKDVERFACDIVFVGHYEADGRDACLRGLVKAGIHVKLYGGGYWTTQVLGDLSTYFGTIQPMHGEDYVKALCGAKICLSFLSKLNRDTYTRRCFEIPACGKLLLCERTEDLKMMFREGEEAVFFSSREELLEKAKWLLSRPDEIARIAAAGNKRVWADGHDVSSRAVQFVRRIEESVSVTVA